ncbi:MAG: 30S ribosomal protein S3 [Ruminococcus sp.]|nr:30S ribosomal protein S3 [Ruminococcus sp.]
MGQKVNPHGLRVGVIKDWDSRWYAGKSDFGDTLVEDYKIRGFIMSKLNTRSKNPANKTVYAGVPKVEIERFADSEGGQKIKIHIHCAKPGLVIGRGGAEIEKLRADIEKMTGKKVTINIIEVRQPDINAQLVAEKIAHDLEDRVSFRRAMKQAMGRAMKLGVKGIKTRASGRLGGAEIARAESYHEGTIPLQTIRADIDYGFAEANTTYGKIGVKVWIYRGEVLKGEVAASDKRSERKPRRRNDDRRQGGRRNDRRANNRVEGGNN